VLREYLFKQQEVQEYWLKLVDFFKYSIKKAYQEGRFFINVAIGCTGGRHRSVAFVHELSQQVLEHSKCVVKHRDIAQDTYIIK